MSKKQKIVIYIWMAMMGVVILVTVEAYRLASRNQGGNSLGIPFEVISEHKSQRLSTTSWSIEILLPENYYSKENLELLFRYCSRKYPDKRDILKVNVYTSKEKLKRQKERPLDLTATFPSTKPGIPYFDASFYRENPGGSVGHLNEWYRYRPNLDNPDEEKIVVLKGNPPRTGEVIVETWETAKDPFRIRVIAFELKGVEPSGIYYTFKSINKEFLGGAHEIMTFRHDRQVPIPRSHVRFINEKIGYIFMGWMYAVTTDGGRTWSVWDAERDLPSWQCCDQELIQEIQIAEYGTGTMMLKPTNIDGKEVRQLYTNDFGQTWQIK